MPKVLDAAKNVSGISDLQSVTLAEFAFKLRT